MVKVWEIDGFRFTAELLPNGEWHCINIEDLNGPSDTAD